MRQLVLSAFIVAGLSGPALAGALNEVPVSMPSPYRPMSSASNLSSFQPKPQLRAMAHRWGFGLDSLPGTGGSGPGGSLVAQPNAVALRWWATDRMAVDLLAAGSASNAGAGGSNGSGNVPLQGYGGGLSFKYNLSEPSRDLLVQMVAKGSYAMAQPSSGTSGVAGSSQQYTTTAGFLGLGFEAFVPGWDWLSLEGSAGAAVTKLDLKAGAASGASPGGVQGGTTAGLGGGNGFSPLNLSIHVYF
jgi:hypothetical protein